MNFLQFDLGNRQKGETVEIILTSGANVRLMSSSDFSSYKSGRSHRYIGGLAKRSPVRLQVPNSGHYVAVDMQGLRGSTRASVRVVPGALPEIREGDLWNKLPRDECLRYACDDEPISLAVARRLAYRLEMPIAELLRGGANARLSFNFAASCPLPKSMCSAHRAGLINSAALVRQLRVYLEDDGTPPSLREIARRIGVSVGALRHHAPAIVKRLADSRRSHLQTTRRAKKQAAQIAVRNGVRHWSKLHPNPIARKSLLKSLMKETGLPKELLRKTIRKELQDQVV